MSLVNKRGCGGNFMFGQFDTSGSASGYLTNPLEENLNMGGFSVENVDNLITTPISEAIDVNNHSVENVKDLSFEESTNKLSTNTDGQLLWAGHTIGSGVSSGVHNPMEESLNVNGYQLNDVGTIHMQDNSSNIWFKDGQNNPRSLTCDNEDDLVWDNKKILTEGDNSNITQDILFNNKMLRNVFGITFNSNPNTVLKDEGGNRLTWNGEDLQTSNWTVDQNASNHKVYDVSQIQFDNAPNVDLTANTTGQLLWNGNVIGHESASGVHNPMQENLNVNNYQLNNVGTIQFDTGDELKAVTNGDETELYFDNMSIATHSYNKATKNTFIKSVSNITEIIGPKNWFVQYTPIPEYGHFTYTFDLFLTFENVIEQGKYKLYLSDSTTGNITENDILIADMDNADWVMGDNGRWSSINFILDNTGSQTNGVVSNTGLNYSLTTGKPYLVLCLAQTNGVPGETQNVMIGKAVSITRNYPGGPSAIYSENSTAGIFNVSAEKEPTFNNDVLTTYKKAELSEVAVSDHIIASFLTESDTSGLLEAKVINDKSAFICDLFFMNNSGTLTLSGSKVQTLSSNPEDNVKFAVDGERINIIVDSSSTDKKNWKCTFNKDYVYRYIDQGYGESLYFPFAEDLNDDITDLTFDSDRGGSWYSFVDNSLLFGSGNTGAYYTTEGAYMNTNTNFSMSFWMKIPSTFSLSSQALILSTTKEDENNNSGWRFMVYSNNLDWNIHLNSGAIVYKRINANALKDDQWHHYVYTYDGESPDTVAESLKAYWDGVDKGSAAVSGTFSKSSPISSFVTDKFAISGKHNSHLLNGLQMSNLRFWNRVITSDEIARLYSERA